MIEYVKNFNSDCKIFQDEVKEYLKDTSIDLEKRWNTFIECDHLLDINGWGGDAMDIYSEALYDDFYMERHQVKLYKEIDVQVTENITPQGEVPDEYSSKYNVYYAKRDEWREAVLAEGYAGFTYDW